MSTLNLGTRVLFTGLVTSTIAILLLQRLSDIGLPITLEVNDWVGGLIVGLVAYGSTDLIYQRLTGEGSEDEARQTEGRQGNG
jgi:ABC-type uncharacterized transport system permease subunit